MAGNGDRTTFRAQTLPYKTFRCSSPIHFSRSEAQASIQTSTLCSLNILMRVRLTLALEMFHEGTAAQIMHVGLFADEGPTIEKLDRFLEEQGYTFRGKHHEIYLNDLRRVAPNKMRTVIRHPFG